MSNEDEHGSNKLKIGKIIDSLRTKTSEYSLNKRTTRTFCNKNIILK